MNSSDKKIKIYCTYCGASDEIGVDENSFYVDGWQICWYCGKIVEFHFTKKGYERLRPTIQNKT